MVVYRGHCQLGCSLRGYVDFPKRKKEKIEVHDGKLKGKIITLLKTN